MENLVAQVRAFNHFYREVLGALYRDIVNTPFSLAEVKVLFELHLRDRMETGELRRLLELDSGYLSRMLGRFEADGLIARERSATDARRQIVELSEAGRIAFAAVDERSASRVRDLLEGVTEEDGRRLVASMATIREVLSRNRSAAPYVIRPPRPGDLGWVVHRHGVLYSQEYGWGQDFEAMVARIVADYADDHDPLREAGWIAEVDGAQAGCVFCVRRDDETAQLRMLLVEPSARGMGIGGRLVEECLRFAAAAGYRRMVLWTRDVLTDARRIYRAAGFERIEERMEGGVVEETWARNL
ncbi:bifunctional helix-turn-helix transcriptional regulator/GNAT family N-acetyltransferase [Streptosporangium carneum]|uniref:MarR family transcriptional regulator n=1 Tax=Streptosporangium carneum TaxID=47481 RepID=A0A9W6MD22_9ACTN|nr:helix-turn-helix domain-containing GNAT family N-acetyltransferase [Streptosporangium carneum]GLK10074.1 MarR family transcriptional regulator [Streptosporangium carneum]